jgi:hypothetical protein
MTDRFWWVVPGLLAVIFSGAMVGINRVGDQIQEEQRIQREWNHKCIEADGVPVDVQEYVKGIGIGKSCVKVTGKIDI